MANQIFSLSFYSWHHILFLHVSGSMFFFFLWPFIYLCIYWLSHQRVDKWGVSKVSWFSHQSEASVFVDLVINLKICFIQYVMLLCLSHSNFMIFFFSSDRKTFAYNSGKCCIGLHDISFQQWHHNRHMCNSHITGHALSSSLRCFIWLCSVFQRRGNGSLFGTHSGVRVSDCGLESGVNLWLVNRFNLKHHGSAHK